ncbi:MAG: hypothetical protein WBI44_07695 [Syntrophaceticus sp.]
MSKGKGKQKRRSSGEGTIYFREDRQRWVAEIPIGIDPITGRMKRKTVSGHTEGEVIDKKRQVELELACFRSTS